MKVAHLTATFPPYRGGAGNTAHRIAVGQAERGHHVEVFTAPAPGEIPSSGGAVVHRIDPVFAIGNAPLIPKLASLKGFDIVHIHYPFIFGAELTLLARARRASREQALLVHYKNRLVGDGRRGALFEAYEHSVAPALIRASDRVCVLSPDHADSVSYLKKTGERNPSKLIEMPNGVDAERFSPGEDGTGMRERLGIPADHVVCAFVATLDRAHHFKRLDVAIDALAKLGDDVHIVVAGGGELVAEFEARAAGLGLADRVHFLGPVPHPELPDVLRASDIFLLTTEPPESFGIVLIEAMATGLPVVATDYPGVRAVVTEGECGLLAPQGDPDAVAARLADLIEGGSDLRERMGAAGRERALAEWNWPRLLDRMDDAYAQAIETRARKTSGVRHR